MKNTKKGDKVVVKAFAVTTTEKALEANMPLALIFNKVNCNFSLGIYKFEDEANDYRNRFSKVMKLDVIPCEISYYKPSPKKLKK